MIAQVALPLPVPKTFTYRVPPDLKPFVAPYVRVKVPFAKRSLTGFVVAVEDGMKDASFTPADIDEVLDLLPIVGSTCFNLCSWAAHHYCGALGLAMKASFPLGTDLEKYLIATTESEGPLEAINGLPVKKAYAVAGKGKVWEYYHQGLLNLRDVFTGESVEITPPPKRSQFSATLFLAEAESRREYYLSQALPVLESGLNVLMLLPDHGMARRYFHLFFDGKLGERVLYYGSQTSPRRRAEVYFKMRKRGGYMVIGTRNCLFLPVNHTALILVERPEDDGYRNDQTLQFNAVTMAGKLAELEAIPICYGSVSPPLDLILGVEEGRILPAGRHLAKNPVEVTRIKRFKAGGGAPRELIDLVEEGLRLDERIVIHTPLKDYAARLHCVSCRRSILCPACGSAVSFRKEDNRLVCWRCGSNFAYDERCKRCGSELIGFGSTGAEYVEEQISLLAPDAKIIKITGDVVKNEGAEELIGTLNQPKTIVVGTQILSKFYNIGRIDRLILLGWEDFLRIAGYRAQEHMHQTYCNLVDALRPARVHLLGIDGVGEPANVLTMNGEDFYKEELERRKIAEFPPFVRLFLLKVDAASTMSAASTAQRIRDLLEKYGLLDNLVGEAARPGAGRKLTMLLKGKDYLPDNLLYELHKVRHLRIEADPPWV